MTSRIQPNTIEETHLHIAQHVGNGHNIQNQAELQQHNELRHCWLPGQNNSLPFLIKNKPTRNTHHTTTTDSSCGHSQISTSQLIQIFSIFQSKTSTSWHCNFKTFLQILASQSQMFCEPWFLQLQIQRNFRHCLVVSVGFPIFLQTNPTSSNFGYDGGISTLYANNFNFKPHALAS